MDGCERFLRNVDEDSLYCPIPQPGHKHREPALQVTGYPAYWGKKKEKRYLDTFIKIMFLWWEERAKDAEAQAQSLGRVKGALLGKHIWKALFYFPVS